MSLVNWNLLSDTASMLLPVASVHNVRNVCQLRYVCPVAQSSGRKSVDMTTRLFTHPTFFTLAPFARQTGGAA